MILHLITSGSSPGIPFVKSNTENPFLSKANTLPPSALKTTDADSLNLSALATSPN